MGRFLVRMAGKNGSNKTISVVQGYFISTRCFREALCFAGKKEKDFRKCKEELKIRKNKSNKLSSAKDRLKISF